jgi:hypothetical protein
MGLMSRNKGKRFERDIAARIRTRFGCDVRRASQAERADNPDIFVPHGVAPFKLTRLWMELQDARQPTPEKKLEQAERDAYAWQDKRTEHGLGYVPRWPVVIWHRLGERTSYATMRVNTLLDIVQPIPDAESELREVVTVELDAFLRMLEVA